jgi:hypothetical protein
VAALLPKRGSNLDGRKAALYITETPADSKHFLFGTRTPSQRVRFARPIRIAARPLERHTPYKEKSLEVVQSSGRQIALRSRVRKKPQKEQPEAAR